MNWILTLSIVLVTSISFAQEKKTIEHTDYHRWKSITTTEISKDGKFIAYVTAPEVGDSYLYVYNTETKALDSIARGTRPKFSGQGGYLAFRIKPGYDTLRTLELKGVKKIKWPKDSLGIYVLANDSLMKFPKLKQFQLSEDTDWGAFQFEHNSVSTPKKKKKKKKRKKEVEYESKGKALWVYNPTTQEKYEYKDVSRFILSDNGEQVAFTTHRKYKVDSLRLNVLNIESTTASKLAVSHTDISKMTWNESATQLAYLISNDSTKIKGYSLAVFDAQIPRETILVDSNSMFLPEGKTVSIHYEPKFTKDGSIVYYGVHEHEHEAPKDTLLDKEKVTLDLWHYQDKRLQPQQLKELKRDEKRADLYAYHFETKTGVQLSNDSLRVYAETDLKGEYLSAYSMEKYEHTYNWVSPRPMDYYRVNVQNGNIELLEDTVYFGVDLAPSGKSFVMFDDVSEMYYSKDLETGQLVCLTCEVDESIVWTYDMNGQPMKAYPIGVEGWNADESKVFIQSEYDLWAYDFNDGAIENVTRIGTPNEVKISPNYWSNDSIYLDASNMYFTGFDTDSKGAYIYSMDGDINEFYLKEDVYFDAKIYSIERSEDASRKVIRTMTFDAYPDIYTYTSDIYETDRVSNVNPQQEEYNWGSVELTKWSSYDSIELEGLIYKPDNFDANKSYPMIAYFYELNSDNLHNYWSPKPTRAALVYAIAEYTSAGYVVFVPDVRYKPGHPAQSAYDCILSGTDHVLNLYPNIDSNRMALQGQSWGGYQTAQLVTMTNRYKCAMAGAPVTNMFSAYGGIRWGSGYNRQFQYERTQSRIGYTIWERPDLYIENSPQFHLPNVETPLLIMHNDHDGAVPWYQGIELFTGLKRLNKEAWLLNYNNDDHNLLRYANRMDLAIRMRQFFDYYLLEEDAPQWLIEGIPATVKGKELRY